MTAIVVADRAGGTGYTLLWPIALLANITGTLTTKFQVGHKFEITAARFRSPMRIPTTASKAVTIQLQVGGTSCTGGSFALTTAGITAVSTAYSFTAITAGATGSAGATIELAYSGVTAFTEGDGLIEIDITRSP